MSDGRPGCLAVVISAPTSTCGGPFASQTLFLAGITTWFLYYVVQVVWDIIDL